MRRVTAEEARKILTGQGLRQPLLQEAEAFRRKYPWQGVREVTVPRYPYFGREILARALAALLSGANLLLVGPKAAGKNILAECLALLLGRPAWNVSFHIDVDASYLIGMDTFKEGEVRFRPGPVHECATQGGVCILDEINMARNEALAVLHSLLDHRRRLEVPGYEQLRLHPATRHDTVGIGVGYRTFNLETAQVAQCGQLAACTHHAAYLGVDVCECGTTCGAYVGLAQCAPTLMQRLVGNAVLQVLHSQLRLTGRNLALSLSAQCFEVEACSI
jgi:hypothetical protein